LSVARTDLSAAGLFDLGVYALAGTVVRLGNPSCAAAQCSAASSPTHAGDGEVVLVAGDDLGSPDRRSVRAHDRLDVPAEAVVLSRVPGIDRGAHDAGGGLGSAVGAEHLAVHHDVRPALLGHLRQGVVQVRGLVGQASDDLVAVAIRGGP